MVVERPTSSRFPPLALGLAYVVHQRCPAQPQIITILTHVLQHLQCVVEIVLMRLAVSFLHHVERHKLWQNQLQQSAALQVHKSAAGMFRQHYLVQLVLYPLAADNLYPLGIALKGIEGLRLNVKVQLRGKPHTAHHAQRVVAEGYIGVERCAYYTVLQVVKSVKGIHQLAKPCGVKAYRHCIDGEVAAVLVVLQRAVLNNRLTRVALIALLACSHKFHLYFLLCLTVEVFHLGSAKILKHRQVSALAQLLLQSLRHSYPRAPHTSVGSYHYINIIAFALQKNITHISSHHVCLHLHAVGNSAYPVQYFLVYYPC